MDWSSGRVIRRVGLVLVLGLVVGGLALAAAPTASAQRPHDIEVRDRLIADQEALLNTYRCMFGVDTQVVPGGCLNGSPVSPPQEPGQFSGTPTDQDIAVRNQLVADQEALLNVYRCRFDIDTALVPGGCQNDESTPEPEASENQSDVLPDNWDELSIAEKIELNPYECPDVTRMRSNGRCLPAEDPTSEDDEDETDKTVVPLKISAEVQASEDNETAEYVVQLDEPEGMNINQVKIQYKIIDVFDNCNTDASWDEYFTEDNMDVYDDLDIMDVHFDRWKDKPDHLVLEKKNTEENINFMTYKAICFKVSKKSDADNIYTSGYYKIGITPWWLDCTYIYFWQVCFAPLE